LEKTQAAESGCLDLPVASITAAVRYYLALHVTGPSHCEAYRRGNHTSPANVNTPSFSHIYMM